MLITLAGPDGAGKSTQAKLLYDHYLKQGYSVKILDKWDILNTSVNPECRFINSSLDELRFCISEMKGESRPLFLFWSIFQSIVDIKDIHDPNIIYISDGYWIKHAASEVLYGHNEDWIRSITSAFPHSDYLFYFDIQPNVTSVRKSDFTPYECGRNIEMKPEQFINHQSSLKLLMDKWSRQDNWVSINANRSVQDVFHDLCNHLKLEVECE
ncbi:hypothetical protein AAFX24_17755 [Vibrio mediterranei]|uniref:hypothetical protein n=1 Tax=Vibrio mediterranei TaxID=689 RepID=UPI0038CE205D